MKTKKFLGYALTSLLLSACSSTTALTDSGNEPGLMLVPVNHTHRYVPTIVVEDAWAGNVSAQGGGGKATCCLAGRKDWSKPALVQWRWGTEEDRVTKQVTVPAEERSALVHFPRAPHRVKKTIQEDWTREDYQADEAYLCVIFRTLDTVELAFSSSGSGCRSK